MICMTAGITKDEHTRVAEYFKRFMMLYPLAVPVTSVDPSIYESFLALMQAVAASSEIKILIIAHGFDDGTGLYVPLVPKGPPTTHNVLFWLGAWAKKNRLSRPLRPRW
jgi:hypothetical protein